MKGRYELKRRAERQAETRHRIVEAAVSLHTTVGPSQTSIAAIAERAGVERHTVYAHFPDQTSLFEACSRHWMVRHPFPEAAAWDELSTPQERLERALSEIYSWYAGVEHELAVSHGDVSLHSTHAALMEQESARLAELRDRLASDWPRRKAVRAAIGHALEFETWRSLVRRQKLTERQAVRSMAEFVRAM